MEILSLRASYAAGNQESHRCPNRNDSQVPVDVLQAMDTDTADLADFLPSTHPGHTQKSLLCLRQCIKSSV